MDTFRLNTSICNKCFVSNSIGKPPHSRMRCGHVFCQDCWQKANKQCTLCENNEVLTVELSEQMSPKVKSLFQPFLESLRPLNGIGKSNDAPHMENIQTNQLLIIMKRFTELEKKNDTLERQYSMIAQKMKMQLISYMNLKSQQDIFEKILLSDQLEQNSSQQVSSAMQTPINSEISIQPSSSGCSSELLGLQSTDVTSDLPLHLTPKQQ